MIDKNAYFVERICPQCHKNLLKNWHNLSPDEKFIAERRPASAELPKSVRERRVFCTNCWYETDELETRA